MTRYLTPLFVVLLLVAAAGPAVAAVEGSPDLSVHLPDNRVVPGEETSLELFLLNEGEIRTGGSASDEARVTTARDVTVTVTAGDAPIDVKTATQPVGSVPEGLVGPIEFAVSVDGDAAPGTYEVPVELSYVYTSEIQSDDDHTTRSETIERTVTLMVEDRARFSIIDASTTAYVGERGDVTLTVENV
ncbi:MAG: sialidase, partial [Actinobacteria bacterium]|nr:sialidase [Actinomycetota bacterium]NIU66789.1 sialidase [Actinomycetota bacterium]NIW28595.1 sialidase [Actinomycetota bacterium]NIX21067.1 sialidase [Actinomycetota bacterium]